MGVQQEHQQTLAPYPPTPLMSACLFLARQSAVVAFFGSFLTLSVAAPVAIVFGDVIPLPWSLSCIAALLVQLACVYRPLYRASPLRMASGSIASLYSMVLGVALAAQLDAVGLAIGVALMTTGAATIATMALGDWVRRRLLAYQRKR
ncbi:MAG: hypothetical protein ABFD92_12370 [Planctomycetaceae bacterium]|nr:hypothetical protein [Planctomycetaceae bacterium]